MEAHSGKENETRHFYNFIVMTSAGIYSIQCDVAGSTSSASKTQAAANTPRPIEIVATYQKRDGIELDSAIGVYTCFSGGT